MLDAGICDNVDLREALFMEDEPSVLAAADTKPGQQQSLLFCATESQSECQMMIGGLKRETRWIQHQSYECMYANCLIPHLLQMCLQATENHMVKDHPNPEGFPTLKAGDHKCVAEFTMEPAFV